jgi:DNA-directed RNA polymerase specialized sigma24 family protein
MIAPVLSWRRLVQDARGSEQGVTALLAELEEQIIKTAKNLAPRCHEDAAQAARIKVWRVACHPTKIDLNRPDIKVLACLMVTARNEIINQVRKEHVRRRPDLLDDFLSPEEQEWSRISRKGPECDAECLGAMHHIVRDVYRHIRQTGFAKGAISTIARRQSRPAGVVSAEFHRAAQRYAANNPQQ